jgi:beta-1,4-mannosyl-glycoprotein beta-1,4-N-acetylglucosaminyltransferase
MSKIIDCCIFNDETEMLNFRLNELDWVIDKFIIIESIYTFQGQKKELVFDRVKEKFSPFRDKIIYVIDDRQPHPNPWVNERLLRNAASVAINKLTLSSEDYVGLSDVDEIPDTDVLNQLKNEHSTGFLGFFPNFYYYNLNCRKKRKLPGPIYGRMDRIYYRFNFELDRMRDALVFAWRVGGGDNEINPCGLNSFNAGGWHLSCFGSVDKIVNKLKSFSHSEYNRAEFTDPEKIKELIKHNKDIVMRDGNEEMIEVKETYLPRRVDLIPQIII